MEQEYVKNKHTDDLVDHYWGCIDHMTKMVRSSELKAGLILSFYGIVLNLIIQNIKTFATDFSLDIPLYILLTLYFLSTLVSIYFSIKSFIPRMEINHDKNVFFFKDIIKEYGDIKQFSKTFFEISKDEDQLFDHLGQQIYINSKIAATKFSNVNYALRFLAAGFLFLFAIVVYYTVGVLF